MIYHSAARLSEFSEVIRESTLRRLMAVDQGDENWRPAFGFMTFSDLAYHLIACDKWLFEKLKNPAVKSIAGKPGEGRVESYKEYQRLLKDLDKVGQMKSMLIKRLTKTDLGNIVFDDRYARNISIWWLIARGNLDHEIHHRGQIATYLALLASDRRHDE